MASKNKVETEKSGEKAIGAKEQGVSLGALLTKRSTFTKFHVWVIGDTPLITHAWSEKARREMLAKQVKAVKPGKETRDPNADFVNSLYDMGNGTFGFPATGLKNAVLSVAHKDKGIPRTDVMAALYLDADMVRTRPALAGAICDMPLIRIFGSDPEMREDMVKVGKGLNKTASLAYRAQFTTWAMRVTGEVNTDVVTLEQLAFLFEEAGKSAGVGEWRNERKGVFGAFHPGSPEEAAEWSAFAEGRGSLPTRPDDMREAA